MWYYTTDRGRGGNDRSLESAIRLQRMGTAVDEIVGAFAALSDLDEPQESQQRRKIAAASRRLWMLASRPARPRNG